MCKPWKMNGGKRSNKWDMGDKAADKRRKKSAEYTEEPPDEWDEENEEMMSWDFRKGIDRDRKLPETYTDTKLFKTSPEGYMHPGTRHLVEEALPHLCMGEIEDLLHIALCAAWKLEDMILGDKIPSRYELDRLVYAFSPAAPDKLRDIKK